MTTPNEPPPNLPTGEPFDENEALIQSLEKGLEECQDKYLRLLAESENARKRMQKEREELTRHALSGVIVEFIHPIDNFEKALSFAKNMSDEVKNWAIGFDMILTQFKQVLLHHGIFEFESIGKRFDPHLHDPVEVVETQDVEPGMVLEEFVKGYRHGDKIIRAARVKVSKAVTKKEEENK